MRDDYRGVDVFKDVSTLDEDSKKIVEYCLRGSILVSVVLYVIFTTGVGYQTYLS